jgi:hypothetical protein
MELGGVTRELPLDDEMPSNFLATIPDGGAADNTPLGRQEIRVTKSWV